MATLEEVTTPEPDGTLNVRDGWRQGRGAYGGLTVAAAIRAIEARVADPRRKVRSVTAEIPGATLTGAAAFTVDVLRSGNSLTVARAALAQSNEVTTHVVAVLAATRAVAEPPTWRELARPEAPDWRDVPPLVHGDAVPEFARHFESRIVRGIPGSGGAAECVGWVRPREPGEARDAAFLAAVIDAWWPAVLVRMPMFRPMATIGFTLEVVEDPGDIDREAPLLYRGTVPVAADGYFLETRELWTADGRLLARNHQTFAVIR